MHARGVVRAFALAVLAACATPAAAQVATLRPVDEAPRDPSLLAFRAALLRAVERRDTAALYAALAPGIVNSFGGDGGVAEFRRTWRPGRRTSEVWPLLERILAAGGAFQDGEFAAPYTFGAFPDTLDAFGHGVAMGTVHVRARPDPRAPVLAEVAHAVLPVDDWTPVAGRWIAVRLRDGRRGYVAAGALHDPLGYRALFAKSSGRWRMTALVAGD